MKGQLKGNSRATQGHLYVETFLEAYVKPSVKPHVTGATCFLLRRLRKRTIAPHRSAKGPDCFSTWN